MRLRSAPLQDFVGGVAILGRVVDARDRAFCMQRRALLRRQRPQARSRRPDQGLLDDPGGALLVERGDQRLTHAQRLDGFGGVEARIDPERLGGGLEALLIRRRIGAQGMLHAGAQLA